MMIIDDLHRIAFVHIPKCAGTTIRGYLKPYDSLNGAHTARVDIHPQLGMLDYVHIPLFALNEHFPEEFKQICEYWSFAVVRDPYKRFASSVSQRIKRYGDKPFQEMSKDEIVSEVARCIEFLSLYKEKDRFLPYDYIHFQPQVDYVYFRGEKIIDDVYLTDQVDELLERLKRIVGARGEEFDSSVLLEKKNKSVVYKNGLIRNVMRRTRFLRRLIVPVLPGFLTMAIRRKVYVDRDMVLSHFFDEKLIRDFIEDYYHDDIAMYKRMMRKP